ncbi:SPJ_0845 family protein [Streptococcus dentiloxodontae]
MAVVQKKSDELENMMAAFAAIPDFEKSAADGPKENEEDEKDKD